MSVTSPAPERHGSATLTLRVERIRKRAADKGAHTVAQIADLFGLSRNQVYQLFRGKHMPRAETAQRMADALGIAVEDLWERS